MSDNKKQEKDYTPEVDALLTDAASVAKVSLFHSRLYDALLTSRYLVG